MPEYETFAYIIDERKVIGKEQERMLLVSVVEKLAEKAELLERGSRKIMALPAVPRSRETSTKLEVDIESKTEIDTRSPNTMGSGLTITTG